MHNHSLQETLIFRMHQCMNMLRRGHSPHRGHGCGHGGPSDGERGRHGGRGGHDAHRGQGRILSLLRDNGSMPQRELAALLRIQPPSLSEALSKLEERGLVERVQDVSDKRVVNVTITDNGRELAAEVEQARQENAEKALSALSQEEQQTLSDLLGKLIGSLLVSLGPDEEGMEDRHGHHGGGCHGRHGDGRGRGHGGCHGGHGPEQGDAPHGCGRGHGRGGRGSAFSMPEQTRYDRRYGSRCEGECSLCATPCGHGRRR